MPDKEVMPIKMRVLLTLTKCHVGISWRRLAGWYYKVSPSSLYQLLRRMAKEGLVYKTNKGTRARFTITDIGIKELEESCQKK